MSRSYIKAIEETLPLIDIVFDRFHVIKLLNDAIDKTRKLVYHSLNKNSRKSLKKSRFLLLKNGSSLLPEELDRLDNIIEKYEVLGIAYMLKEDLRGIWNVDSSLKARKYFIDWALDVISLVIDGDEPKLMPLHSFAKTLLRHLPGILSYWNHKITNGRAEGLNNKIKT
jgi:transposase